MTGTIAAIIFALFIIEVSGGIGWPIGDPDIERGIASVVIIALTIWLFRRIGS